MNWISTKDRLPANSAEVWAYIPEIGVERMWFGSVQIQGPSGRFRNIKAWNYPWPLRIYRTDVTHWMPIAPPLAPTVGSEATSLNEELVKLLTRWLEWSKNTRVPITVRAELNKDSAELLKIADLHRELWAGDVRNPMAVRPDLPWRDVRFDWPEPGVEVLMWNGVEVCEGHMMDYRYYSAHYSSHWHRNRWS